MEFASVETYIDAVRRGEVYPVLPVKSVATYCGVSPDAIRARIKKGSLLGCRIGRTQFVSVASLVESLDKAEEPIDIVEKFLIRTLREGTNAINYEPVMSLIGLDYHNSYHRGKMGRILGEVSRRSDATEPRCLLSVIVHRKDFGRPSDSFFGLASQLGYEFDDYATFVKEQTAIVKQRYGRPFRKSK